MFFLRLVLEKVLFGYLCYCKQGRKLGRICKIARFLAFKTRFSKKKKTMLEAQHFISHFKKLFEKVGKSFCSIYGTVLPFFLTDNKEFFLAFKYR